MKNSQLIDENPFVASNKTGSLEKLQSRLRARAGMDSAKQSAAHLLGESYLTPDNWQDEKRFGRRTSCLSPPRTTGVELMRTGNRSTCPGGLIFPFQILFLLDIGLRAVRLKRRFPAVPGGTPIRHWIDLPLLIPFWRLLRVVPVTERLSSTRMIQLEPLRAAVDEVVAVLALELFEVITLQPWMPPRTPSVSPLAGADPQLCSHQSVDDDGERNWRNCSDSGCHWC